MDVGSFKPAAPSNTWAHVTGRWLPSVHALWSRLYLVSCALQPPHCPPGTAADRSASAGGKWKATYAGLRSGESRLTPPVSPQLHHPTTMMERSSCVLEGWCMHCRRSWGFHFFHWLAQKVASSKHSPRACSSSSSAFFRRSLLPHTSLPGKTTVVA